MILHLYHCNLASFKDYQAAPGRNRPDGTGRYPERPGEADINYIPSTKGFDDDSMGRLLEVFQSISLSDPQSSPIKINWKVLEKRLGMQRSDVRHLLSKADLLGLMSSLTIDYDHESWLRHSKEKGCFVVMTCVEKSDLARDNSECASAYCDAIDEIKSLILNKGHTLNNVFVIPNGHLAPRAGNGLPWEQALDVLLAIPPALRSRGYDASMNSYGYTKRIKLGINAHKLGYVLRVV